MNPRTITTSLLLLLFSASPCRLVRGAITAAAAVNLAPHLLGHLAGLEDTLEGLRTDQIVLAAVRMRSLVPGYTVKTATGAEVASSSSDDEEAEKKKKTARDKAAAAGAGGSDSSSSEESSSNDSDSDSDELVFPNHQSILISSLNSLLKSLPSASRDEATEQIFGFDFGGPKSMETFLAEKDVEAARKLEESLATIRSIQGILRSNSPAPAPVTVSLLSRIVAKLDNLEDEYEELQELQKQTKSSKASKQQKAAAKLPESRAKIAKIVQKLAVILD